MIATPKPKQKRAEEVGTTSEVPTEYHCFQSDDVVYSVRDGKILHRRLEPFEERTIGNRPTSELQIYLGDKSLVLPFGLIVISGTTKVGKSSFLRHLAEQTRILRVYNAVEPYDGPEDVVETYSYRTADIALAYAIRDFYDGTTQLIGLDSLRAPLFETSGAAGEKGIIMPFFTALTRVSNSLATAGVTVFATVNPMNEDDDYQERFLLKLAAATTGAILLEKDVSSGFVGTIELRDRGGADHRKKQRFNTLHSKPAANSVPVATPVIFAPALPRPLASGLSAADILKLEGITT